MIPVPLTAAKAAWPACCDIRHISISGGTLPAGGGGAPPHMGDQHAMSEKFTLAVSLTVPAKWLLVMPSAVSATTVV